MKAFSNKRESPSYEVLKVGEHFLGLWVEPSFGLKLRRVQILKLSAPEELIKVVDIDTSDRTVLEVPWYNLSFLKGAALEYPRQVGEKWLFFCKFIKFFLHFPELRGLNLWTGSN